MRSHDRHRRLSRLIRLGLLLAWLAPLVMQPPVPAESRTAAASPAPFFDLPGCGTSTLPATDAGSTTSAVPLGFSINYFGTTYSSLYVNNNGNVTFNAAQSTYTPFNLNATTPPIIAVFFADVDTRTSTGGGTVTYGQTTFNGRPAFCVNWTDVVGYGLSTSLRNSFQLLIVNTTGTDADLYFNYAKVQWDKGSLSSTAAGAGYAGAFSGSGSRDPSTFYQIPGSLTSGAFLDSAASGLTKKGYNTTVNGRYLFHLASGQGVSNGQILGTISSSGNPVAAAPVAACVATGVNQLGTCQLTSSDSAGKYNVSGLAAGNYYMIVMPPAGSSLLAQTVGPVTLAANQQLTQNVGLLAPTPPPAGLVLTTSGQTVPNYQGVPIVFLNQPFDINVNGPRSCSGTYTITQNGQTIKSGTLTETPAGSGVYKASVTLANGLHGAATLTVSFVCSGSPQTPITSTIYIDPSGYVKTVDGTPIVGATVTLYRSDSIGGPFDVVPNGSAIMAPFNRNNPDTTDGTGHFGWDVIPGFYKVRAAKAGCVSPSNPAEAFVDSAVLTIPPAVIDLDLRLNCGGGGATLGNLKFITPVRILDTRGAPFGPIGFNAAGAQIAAGQLADGSTTRFKVAGKSFGAVTVPADVTGVLVNVTLVQGSGSGGFVTVYPGDAASPPNASTVNPSTAVSANFWSTGVPTAGANAGTIAVTSVGAVRDVLIDLVGYYSPTAPAAVGNLRFVTPVRVLDTRVGSTVGFDSAGNAIAAGQLAAGATRSFTLAGKTFGGVAFPADVAGVIAHVTTVQNAGSGGFVTLLPGGTAGAPGTSTVNPSTAIAFNSWAVGIPATGQTGAGQFSLYSTNQLDVIVDIVGYFAPSNAAGSAGVVGQLTFITPVRALDTRGAPFGPLGFTAAGAQIAAGQLSPGSTSRYLLNGKTFAGVAIPSDAKGVLVNVTSVQSAAGGGFVTVFPGDAAQAPGTSTVNPSTAVAASFWASGIPTAAGSNNGTLGVYSVSGPRDVLIDVVGYFR